MRTNRVERVAAQLVIALHDLKQIQLQAAIHLGLFRVAVAVRFGRKVRVLNFSLDACYAFFGQSLQFQ